MSRDRLLAWAALAATILIWAGVLITARAAAVSTSFGPVEVGLMRFGTAMILFAPVLRHDGVPRRSQLA